MNVADFPQRPEIDVSRIPEELKKIPKWVVWRYESRKLKDGIKYTKPPYHPTGRKADPTDPKDWSTFEEVEAALDTGKWHGAGLVLDGQDGLVGWDMDHVIDPKSGEITSWADQLISEIDSYTEISPSGEGIRVIAIGSIPQQGKKVSMPGGTALECYSNARYITVTGQSMPGRTKVKQSDCETPWKRWLAADPQIKKALRSERVAKLMAGDLSDFSGDHSAADLALCQALVKKLGGDREKIDQAFRTSGLYRTKWDERHSSDGRTYGEMTIDKAIEGADFQPSSPLTDTGNATRFVRLHGHELRYCVDGWYVWDGRRLMRDELGQAELWAKDVAADLEREASEQQDIDNKSILLKSAREAESRHRRDAIVALAKLEPPIPVRMDDLDSRPDLFCCKNGVVQNGEDLLPHQFDFMITRSSPINYVATARSPMWSRFLEEIFPDVTIREYVQRIVGYTITGDTSEQEFYFCYGTGANGKSAFFDCLREVLGDYMSSLPTNSLMESKYEQHPTALMALRGSRLVLASEVSEGRRLNEELIKATTGESRMQARRMRQDFIDFRSSAKLWIMGNHKPTIRGTDDAIWRRVRVIPFVVQIPEKQRVRHLGRVIGQKEGEGVLAWCVEGWRKWRKHGTAAPDVIRSAVTEYRNEMDQVGVFLAEECLLEPDAVTANQELYARYSKVVEQQHEHVMSLKAFSQRLSEKGLEPLRDRVGRRAWKGVRLREALSTNDIY